MDEVQLVHVVEGANETSLTARFVSILERNVGAEYYQYLYLVFSSLEELKNKNLQLREKIDENNSFLENYQSVVENLHKKIEDIKGMDLKQIENLIDIKYNEKLDEKIGELKNRIDLALNDIIDANNALKPSEELETEIANIKAEIKELYQDIKFAYSNLRALGKLKIFESHTKQECRYEFLNSFNSYNREVNYESVFEKLWDLALNEANGLNKIANMAKQITIKYPSGQEKFEKEDVKKIEMAIAEYDNNFSQLSTITDQELLANE